MTASLPRPGLDDESGFTLVELLVAVSLSILILFGILNTLDGFSSNAARQTRITEANDQVRKAMDRIVSDLRQSTTIEVADADNLVYTVADSATSTRRERICLDSSNGLWRSSSTSPSTFAPGAPCPLPSTGAYKITSLVAANNSTTNPLFRYDSLTPGSVRSVGLTFALNAGNSGRADLSTLRASTFVRAQSEKALPVSGGQISTSCNNTTRVPTLTLASSVGATNVSYTDIEGNQLGSGSAGSAVTLSSATPTATTVVANITTTAGLVSQLVKIVECPA